MKKNKDKMYLYRFLRYPLGLLFLLYYNPKIYNKEVIPKDGAVIFAGNHKHLYDQNLVILATKRPVHYMAKSDYFKGPFAWFFKANGCISVNRNGDDEKAKKQALKVLENGFCLGIFPEGTRNKTKEVLLPLKFGCVSMAKKTNAYIVPFGITGEYKFRSHDLAINFGKPFKVDDDLEKANKYLANQIIELMQKSVK